MSPHHDLTPTWTTALKIAAAYAIIGALWILSSGWFLHHLVNDQLLLAKLEAVKGWFYVLVTAALLGGWLNHYFRQIRITMELLRKSEARFMTIFKASPVAIGISRLSDGVFIDANEAFVQLCGYPLQEILGRDSEQLRLWHSDNRTQTIADLHKKDRVVVEMQSRRKNGEIRDLLAFLQQVELDDQPCILGTLLDVTERRRAETAMREGDERLRFALESCRIGTWDLDLANNTAVRSLEHAHIFGYATPLSVWTREIFINHVLPQDRALVSENIKGAIDNQSGMSFECRIRRADGQVRWIWVAGRYRIDAGGKTRHLAGVVQDISERKAHVVEIERLSRLYATMSQINQCIVRVNSHEELTREVARVAVQFGGFKMAWIGRHNPQTHEVTPLGWAGEQWETVGNFRHHLEDTAERRCLCTFVIGENRSCVFNDLSTVSDLSEWLTVTRQAGIRAAAVFPIRVRDTLWGVFGVYDGEPDVFHDKEIALLEETAMDIGYAVENIDNEAQRRQAEKFQLLSTTILGILNEPLTLQEAGNTILGLIKKETDLDAVGIRLQEGDDFPYFSAQGLDMEFLLAENSVILRSEAGTARRDTDGKFCLRCVCGMVLSQKCGPSGDHVTAAGSIWTNDAVALVEALNGNDQLVTSCHRCIREGFLSMALIPIRADQQMIGLLHLSDRRRGQFTPETISFFERLAASFGIAVKRKQAEEALQQSKAHLRTLVDTLPDLVWLKDPQGVYLSCNHRFESFFGVPEAKVVGKTDYDFLDREQADFFRANDAAAVAVGGPRVNEEEITFASDGHRELLETIKTPMFDTDGRLVGVLGIARDITMRRQQERERANLETQLQQAQKMESVGRLAGGVAHDFNNMLTVILGHTDLLIERLDPTNPLREDLKEIRKAGQRSADLTRQLLAFARKQTVEPKVVDLNRTLAGIAKMIKRLIGENIDLEWIPGDQLWPVNIDPGQIDQMLANLCINARDAIAGVGKVTIVTGNCVFDKTFCTSHADIVPGEYVKLAVSDNGCGMDDETMAHLFEPFFTTKELGKGTGLGLATVYGVVKQNNGLINVSSEPGRGTTFTIYLPRHLTETVSLPEKDEEKPSGRGHETVLLVEDEPAILQMIKRILEREGYSVVAAGTPGEAIRLARELAGDIHLLVTDVVMPEMNGRDLAKNILTLYPRLRVLFMSGYTTNVIAHHGVIDEGVNFIEKPFTKGVFTHKVREVLNRE
jgi:PAS domain S-box-containing protein